MSFYNTTGLSSDQLRAAKDACNRQESHVLALFRKHVTLSPSECHVLYSNHCANPNDAPPITSIRRAITDLTERGLLVKSATMRRGAYGKPEHCWTLATGEPQAAHSAEPQTVAATPACADASPSAPSHKPATLAATTRQMAGQFVGELFATTPGNAGTY